MMIVGENFLFPEPARPLQRRPRLSSPRRGFGAVALTFVGAPIYTKTTKPAGCGGSGEKKFFSSGVVILPTVIILGGLLVLIALVGIFLAYIFNLNNYGIRLSARALAASRAGVEDARLKLVRDKDYPAGSYNLEIDGLTVTVDIVRICNDNPIDCPGLIENQVVSQVAAMNKKRELTAVFVVDKTTGLLQTESLLETPI